MTKISQLSAVGSALAPNDQFFIRDVSDASTPVKSATTADILTAKSQVAATAINVSSGLTPSILKAGLITATIASGISMVLPSGSVMEASYTTPYANLSLEWYVVNTSAVNSVTISGVGGHSIIGNAVVSSNTSGHFLTRRSTTNVYITYRVS